MAVFVVLAIVSLCLFFAAGITDPGRALAQTSEPAQEEPAPEESAPEESAPASAPPASVPPASAPPAEQPPV
ncbi:MAG: hypothetical protein M3N03_01420, partial [Actinomycetota bacterium]|nr:hypothetical protein [Actinomycetota bacterium]